MTTSAPQLCVTICRCLGALSEILFHVVPEACDEAHAMTTPFSRREANKTCYGMPSSLIDSHAVHYRSNTYGIKQH